MDLATAIAEVEAYLAHVADRPDDARYDQITEVTTDQATVVDLRTGHIRALLAAAKSTLG